MKSSNSIASNWKPGKSWLIFALLTIALLWTAHVIAFFPHEYSHSFMAWLLGWKSNPLSLNYGHLNAGNLLAQFDIDENVNYEPIFAGRHGYQAGIIALAGLFIGNFIITYPLSRWGYHSAKKRGNRTAGLFFYWLCLASVGNLIDYVPIRTFAGDGDMHTVVMGFNISPWLIMVVLGIPCLGILGHFLFFFVPRALHWLFPESAGRRVVMVILTAFALFGFYGAAGWAEADPVSHTMSVCSVYVLVPLALIVLLALTERFWMKKTSL
jgi:hypothetical protein